MNDKTAKLKLWIRLFSPLPMLSQMVIMLFMAMQGRPDMTGKSPDWLLHLVAYALLTLSTLVAWSGLNTKYRFRKNRLAATITVVLFAIIDEGLQYFSLSRSAQVSDLIMDFVGIGFCILLFSLFPEFKKETLND